MFKFKLFFGTKYLVGKLVLRLPSLYTNKQVTNYEFNKKMILNNNLGENGKKYLRLLFYTLNYIHTRATPR